MSAGPIQQWRAGWKIPPSVPRGEAVCAESSRKGRGYCGLTKPVDRISGDLRSVSCPECQAAIRADAEAGS